MNHSLQNNSTSNQHQFGEFYLKYFSDTVLIEKSDDEFLLVPKQHEYNDNHGEVYIIKIFSDGGNWFLQSDPCGLFSPFYIPKLNFVTNSLAVILEHSNNKGIKIGEIQQEHFYGFGETPFYNVSRLMPTYKLNLFHLTTHKNHIWLPQVLTLNEEKDRIEHCIILMRNYLKEAAAFYKLRVGITGGYDSSIILAILLKYQIPFEAFIFVGDKNSYNDLKVAKLLAKRFKFKLDIIFSENLEVNNSHVNSYLLLGGSINLYHRQLKKFQINEMRIMGICGECGIFEYSVDAFEKDYRNADKSMKSLPSTEKNEKLWLKYLGKIDKVAMDNNFLIDCRLGGWGSAHMSMCEVKCQIMDPYNQRFIVQLMTDLGIKYRSKRYFHKLLLKELNEDILNLVIKNKSKSRIRKLVEQKCQIIRHSFR